MELIINKYQQDIQNYKKVLLKQEQYNKQIKFQCIEENIRTAKNKWKKIWKRLRLFNGPYKNPLFYAQNDQLWKTENNELNQKNEQNKIYTYKIDKYEFKNRARPFLKLKLIEPQFVESNIQDLKERSLKGLVQSIYEQNKLLQFNNNQITNQKFLEQENGLTAGVGNMLFNIGKNLQKTFKQLIIWDENNQQQFKQNLKLVHDVSENNITDEIYLTKKCQWIKTLTLRLGNLCITSERLMYFYIFSKSFFRFQYEFLKQTDSHIPVKTHILQDNRRLIKEWQLEQIREIYTRRFILQKTAIEIFLFDGQSVLLNFPEPGDQDEICKKLLKLKKIKNLDFIFYNTFDQKKQFEKNEIIKKWQNQEISNFEYLMQLNSFSGRSYKDCTQYPVFPWIISDYESNILDSNNNKQFRDLSLPMGLLGSQERTNYFLEKYQCKDISSFDDNPAFHYGTHYSSSGTVQQFLIRLQPFTDGNKKLHNGKFDFADRIFDSIQDTYQSAITNVSDVRELIPEFYCFPEIFQNLDNNQFGTMQNGHIVNDVIMPKWADNPYKFIVQQRKILENENTSKNINNWINLIFGYKSRGKEAEKAINVFYYLTYEDSINLDNIKDEQTKISIETQIVNFGLTPSQLFLQPHISKLSNLLQFKLISSSEVELKVYRPPQKQIKKSEYLQLLAQLNIFQLPLKAIIKIKWISESRFINIQRDGKVNYYKWYNTSGTSYNQQMIPFQCGIERESSILLEKQTNEFISTFDQSTDMKEYPIQLLNLGKMMVIGGFWDGKIKLIQLENNILLDVYSNHTETVTYISMDSKEKFLITGTKTGDVILWKISPQYKFYVKNHFFDHDDQITQIKISIDMRIFATSSLDGSINIYNIYNGVHLRTIFHCKKYTIQNLILSSTPLPCIIFFSDQDQTFYSYSINGQLLMQVRDLNCIYVSNLIIVKDINFSEILIYGNQNGDIYIRELPFLNLVRALSVSPQIPVLQFLISKDRRFLICACADGEISVITDPNIKSKSLNQ